MRNALGLMLASVVTAVLITGVWFWTSSPRADAAPPQTIAARKAEPLPAPAAAKAALKDDVEITASLSKPAPAPAPIPAAQPARSTCANPDALGVSRIVVIDTTGGPGFGFLQYKQFDFLTDKEVVLTFDDGPWPTTPAVLKALSDECTKAIFFPVGKHTTYHPEILRQVYTAGHTVGSHTWSHAHLDGKKMTEPQVTRRDREGLQRREDGDRRRTRAVLPLPGPRGTRSRRSAISPRATSRCFRSMSIPTTSNHQVPTRSIQNVMTKLDKQGKGVILMHDLQKHTAIALPTLLRRLKAGGYKVVQMKAKEQLETLPEYDAMLVKDQKVPAVASRPISSVVQTVSQ